jgi:hypothetical protein
MGLHTFIIITLLVLKAINLVRRTSLDFSWIKATQTGSLSKTHKTHLLRIQKYAQPLFYAPLVIHLFCFNAPCQYALLLNLCPLIFSVTPFGWLHFSMLTLLIPLFLMGIFFNYAFFIYAYFFRNTTRA